MLMGVCGPTRGKKPSYHWAAPLADEHKRTSPVPTFQSNPGHLGNIPTELNDSQLKNNDWETSSYFVKITKSVLNYCLTH